MRLFWKIFFTSKKGGFLHQIANSVIRVTLLAHGGISIKLFVVYLHIINECLSYKFHPYSILTGHTKVESVVYQVFKEYFLRDLFSHIWSDNVKKDVLKLTDLYKL